MHAGSRAPFTLGSSTYICCCASLRRCVLYSGEIYPLEAAKRSAQCGNEFIGIGRAKDHRGFHNHDVVVGAIDGRQNPVVVLCVYVCVRVKGK